MKSLNHGGSPNGENAALSVRTPEPDTEPQGFSILSVLLRRRGTFFVVAAGCLVLAVAYLCATTPRYTSTSRLYLVKSGPQILSDVRDLLTQGDSYLYTQAELLRSQSIISAALKAPGVAGLKVLSGHEDTVRYVQQELDVDVGKKDEIVSVQFSAPNPNEAAAVVNAVVEAYVQFQSDRQRSTSVEVLKVLQSEKQRRMAELDEQNALIMTFKAENPAAFFETQKGNISIETLEVASEQLTRAKMATQSMRGLLISQNDTQRVRMNLADAEMVEGELEKVVADLKSKATQVTAAQERYTTLQQERNRIERAMDLLDARIKEVNATENAGALNINVLESARAESKPSYPRKSLTLGLALIVAVWAGIGAALLREWLDQRLRSPEDASLLLQLPILGAIPVFNRRTLRLDRRNLVKESFYEVSEAYRSLRAVIHFGLPDRPTRTLLVTSPDPGEGKSITAAHLSMAFANAGRRTLLVDADLRNPSQHEAFGISNSAGLAGVLAGDTPLMTAISPGPVPGMDVLPSGRVSTHPSELLEGKALGQLLQRLSKMYDQVIIDSAPVLAVCDARLIASHCDASILVVRVAQSTQSGTVEAWEHLKQVRANVIGLVATHVAARKHKYVYGGAPSGRPEPEMQAPSAPMNGDSDMGGSGRELALLDSRGATAG